MTEAAAAPAAPAVVDEKIVDAAPTAPDTQTAPAAAPAASVDAPAEAAAVKANFPDDWRVLAAKGDAKKVDRLSRYASFEAATDALFEAQDAIRSGKYKIPAPEDGEALKRWRSENGIPDAPDKYEVKLSNDLVVGEDEKPIVNEFLAIAHESNLPPAVVNKALDWYFNKQEDAMMQTLEADDTAKRTTEEALRQEWGGGYKANMDEIANHMVGVYGKDFASQLHVARLPDGRLLGNVPEFTRALLAQSRELNPGATLVPGSSNTIKAVGDRIQEINTTMRTNPDAYWKNPAMQAEFGELLQAQEKIKARSQS